MDKKMKKKMLMVVLLIIFIIFIILMIVKINDKATNSDNTSTQSVNATNQNTSRSNIISATTTGRNTVRKSSNNVQADENNMIAITDNYFIQQTNDIFYNLDDYIGKTIKIEGLIYSYQDYPSQDICYAVVRNTPGCCGSDGLAGLDIRYNGEYPEINKWVEIVGVLGTDKVYGDTIPVIQVVSMTEKEAGATFVKQ